MLQQQQQQRRRSQISATTFCEYMHEASKNKKLMLDTGERYAEQRLACVNADGAARLVLSFKNHIRRRGGTVVRTARDLRLPQVPEAPVDTHRPREATAVDSAETTIVPACPNFTTGAHAILAHQDILGGWRVGLTNSSPVLNSEEERDRAPD